MGANGGRNLWKMQGEAGNVLTIKRDYFLGLETNILPSPPDTHTHTHPNGQPIKYVEMNQDQITFYLLIHKPRLVI